MAQMTLYGSEMSYFSGKARAYLRWKGVEFVEITPTPDIMKRDLLPVIGWPVIPVLKLADGKMVQDSADIISHIEAEHPAPSVMPAGPVQSFVSCLLQLYADEWLTLPAMHYRWTHNLDWVYSEFGKNALPDGNPEEQLVAGQKVGQRFRNFLPLLGITDVTAPGIEASYEALLREMSAHFEQHAYLFGARPSFADFALIGPLYAHQYRDPYSGALMKRLAPSVANWVERVVAGEQGDGGLLGGDEIPETLLAILRRQMREQLPVLAASNAILADWSATVEAGSEVPRGIGTVELEIDGCKGPCAGRTFPLYRLQDALDIYHGMDAEAQARANRLLAAIGGESLSAFKPGARLTRRNYRLCLA